MEPTNFSSSVGHHIRFKYTFYSLASVLRIGSANAPIGLMSKCRARNRVTGETCATLDNDGFRIRRTFVDEAKAKAEAMRPASMPKTVCSISGARMLGSIAGWEQTNSKE